VLERGCDVPSENIEAKKKMRQVILKEEVGKEVQGSRSQVRNLVCSLLKKGKLTPKGRGRDRGGVRDIPAGTKVERCYGEEGDHLLERHGT